MGGYVYIMTNKPQGTLYIGVTSNLARRVWEHREGVLDGFTRRYGLNRLAHYEFYDPQCLAAGKEPQALAPPLEAGACSGIKSGMVRSSRRAHKPSHPEDLLHFVAEVIDDLDADAT